MPTAPSTTESFAYPAITFRDLIEHLSDSRFGIGQDQENRLLKRAVRAAFRELLDAHGWRYALAEYQIPLVEPYETGTIAYDHEGGTYDRQLTLSDGTWPDWAAYGRIKIDSQIYPIATRESEDIVTLDSQINPGADIDADTDYILYRNAYELPDDLQRMGQIVENGTGLFDFYIEQEDWLRRERYQPGTGNPFGWTITNDPKRSGGFLVRLVGYPTTDKNIIFLYQRQFSDPTLGGFETKCTTGTVKCNTDSVNIGGTGTTFDSTMVGAILRISANSTDEPTGADGLNPAAETLKIKSVETALSLTTYGGATQNLSGMKFCISSQLDVTRPMHNALLRCAERQLALISGDSKRVALADQQYVVALRQAMENDDKLLIMRSVGATGGAYGISMPDPTQPVQSS